MSHPVRITEASPAKNGGRARHKHKPDKPDNQEPGALEQLRDVDDHTRHSYLRPFMALMIAGASVLLFVSVSQSSWTFEEILQKSKMIAVAMAVILATSIVVTGSLSGLVAGGARYWFLAIALALSGLDALTGIFFMIDADDDANAPRTAITMQQAEMANIRADRIAERDAEYAKIERATYPNDAAWQKALGVKADGNPGSITRGAYETQRAEIAARYGDLENAGSEKRLELAAAEALAPQTVSKHGGRLFLIAAQIGIVSGLQFCLPIGLSICIATARRKSLWFTALLISCCTGIAAGSLYAAGVFDGLGKWMLPGNGDAAPATATSEAGPSTALFPPGSPAGFVEHELPQ